MTKDEIISTYSMRDIVERYGIHINHSGFCLCPFHSEKTASLKIYKDSFYCFGCHEHGDIFTFVQKMDNCSFKEAYKSLGGESGVLSDAAITRIARRKREAQKHRKRLEDALHSSVYASSNYQDAQAALADMEPFSDEWCAAQNRLQSLERDADISLTTYLDAISEGT